MHLCTMAASSSGDHGNNKAIITTTTSPAAATATTSKCSSSQGEHKPLIILTPRNFHSNCNTRQPLNHKPIDFQVTIHQPSQSINSPINVPYHSTCHSSETMPLLTNNSRCYSNLHHTDPTINLEESKDQENYRINSSTDNLLMNDHSCPCTSALQDRILHLLVNFIVFLVFSSSFAAFSFSIWLIFYVCMKMI